MKVDLRIVRTVRMVWYLGEFSNHLDRKKDFDSIFSFKQKKTAVMPVIHLNQNLKGFHSYPNL